MKFIHTADWHLGRSFHEVNLVEDQEYILAELIVLIEKEKPDVLIVAGDVYDRAQPAVDAIRLLENTINTIVLEMEVPLVMIAGNHDSPDRLAFGSQLYMDNGLHIAGPNTSKVIISDEHGEVDIHLIPYARPEEARAAGLTLKNLSHDAAIEAQVEACVAAGVSKRSIGVAHAFVTNCESSESERYLSVGGASTVSADHFDVFAYTALGHLHRPQEVRDNVQYSGSLLKYSFSETEHVKGVIVGEIDAKGNVTTEFVELEPRRDVRIMKGEFKELHHPQGKVASRRDYIEFKLTDKVPVINPMSRLREIYPNALSVRRLEFESAGADATATGRHRLKPADLFANLFEEMSGEPLSKKEIKAFSEILADVQKNEQNLEGN
ncbi:MAG: exonuclease SbcCD subunit D [Planctomycetaceae bacterium]|jgi:DNA repair protein SbcD/Mre11|nr:exonuclease SbcCD subunit D [Planctomycetaceae bacterium]MBT4726501.1 exonuclease SbcCD subunit D [Planctomycetaceae bacterium]MBT4843930.1 exonuclease SbcCD subunit D [Planctomycetaceae bacterium]MBT5124965.1 exonuclease SbcCD subunit D [Planctomycetaceae bacterium]MBT5597177.1 exonuclease SbcCD subunit D [Planctomycetaceae bacterium]